MLYLLSFESDGDEPWISPGSIHGQQLNGDWGADRRNCGQGVNGQEADQETVANGDLGEHDPYLWL